MVRGIVMGLVILLSVLPVVWPGGAFARREGFSVVPFEFDPGKTRLVRAVWLQGIGCPTLATVYTDNPSTQAFDPQPQPFADAGCPTGDAQDATTHEGLLLVKTGPTATNAAAAGAELKGVEGSVLTELGYDIRKPGTLGGPTGPAGSHCRAGSPRFNVAIADVTYFIACSSPAPTVAASSEGWIRLRWGGGAPLMAVNASSAAWTDISGRVVESIRLVFDEAQDARGGPDQLGLAVLDNIAVNGILVGHAPVAGR